LTDSRPDLPLLPPVDGRNQWEAIISGTKEQPSNVNIRSDYLHLSPETVIKYPWKLITGKHPYGFWQGTTFPNCTANGEYEATWPRAGRYGPTFTDFKMMDIPVFIGGQLEDYDELTYTIDCGKFGCLYNIETDPGEHHDVAKDHPELREQLLNELMFLNMSTFLPNRGEPSFASCETAIDQGGFYGPFSHLPDGYYSERPPFTEEEIMQNELLKEQLRVFENEETRDKMLKFVENYGKSEEAVRNMHKNDACLDEAGNVLETRYCPIEDGTPDPQCETVMTTLEYPDHIIPEFK